VAGRLTLRLRDWGDGTAELRAEVQAGGFSGVGAATFNRQTLRERARTFSTFPLKEGETVEIAGGYWGKDNSGLLVEEHLYIGVSATNARGTLAMRVRLAVPADDSQGGGMAVSVVLRVEHEALMKFSQDFLALVGTNAREIVLLETT
jgi:hypothetical protein